MSIKVKNINGTSDNTCKCGSWLSHWKRFGGGSLPTYCAESGCMKPPSVGAHVQKDSSDRAWYIVPVCDKHNAKADAMTVTDGTTFVSANVKETCGR